MSKRLSIEDIKKRLYDIHGDTLTLDESTYINTHAKCRLIDKEHGEWWATLHNIFLHKQSHPKRAVENRKQTNLKKYGHGCSLQSKEVQEKRKQTWLENYGCTNPSQNKEVQEKYRQTMLEKYGCENPSQNMKIQQKKKQTWLEKYGCEHPSQNKQVQEKTKQTMVRKYDCEHPNQNPDIAQKAARSQATSTVLKHWKTGQEIVCQAGWEPKVVQYFNDRQIDFVWQIKFDMPNGKKYFVDCYLPEQDLYIEIKGYMRPISKEKFDWFKSEHSNTELWDRPKLKSLGILK
jgi:hypothetical protein